MIEFRFTRHHLAGLAVITTPDPTKHIKLRGNSTGHCPEPENPIKRKKKKTKTPSEDIPKHFILLNFHFFLHVFLDITCIYEKSMYIYHYSNVFISRENVAVPIEL